MESIDFRTEYSWGCSCRGWSYFFTANSADRKFIEAKKKEIQMQQALGQTPTSELSNLPPRPQGRDRPKVNRALP